MKDKLAGLVLPDRTPIDEAALPPPAKARQAAAATPAKSPPPPRKPPIQKPERRSPADWAILASGLALAGVCAVFPWYIFFNQDEFGTKAVTFRTATADAGAMTAAAMPDLAGARDPMSEIPLPSLDMQSTGSVPTHGGTKAVQPPEDQPFPGAKPDFKLVLVANDRAMVEDANGYWVVQVGSWLPDGSSVASIEKRKGKWVLVTSRDAVVALAGN